MRVSNNTEWLFFHLWKKNPETLLSCPNVHLAETILFRWAQPYFWYYTTKDGALVRKTKEKVNLSHLEESFLNNVSKCGVVATCLNSVEDANLKTQEKIEFDYIEQSNFHDFLFQKEKAMNLVMQKFIEPKNNQNALIKVSWTPQFCILFRKTNIHELNNLKVPLVNRLTTFEGPEHLSNSDSVSNPLLSSELEKICQNIVKHINAVTTGNIQLSKMTLYFKLDERNRLYLLFCTDIKFRDKAGSMGKLVKKKTQRPLSPILTVVTRKEEKILRRSMTQQFLPEDQINQINVELCLKCGGEGLLFDIKIRLVLDYEERLIQEHLQNQEDEELFLEQDIPQNTKYKIDFKIPGIMKKIFSNITEEKYLKLKSNMTLMNTPVKLCENCYLEVTENHFENNEERRIKSLRIKHLEKSPKHDNFGLQTSTSRDNGSISPKIKFVSNNYVKIPADDSPSPVRFQGHSTRSSKVLNQILSRDEFKETNKDYRAGSFGFHGEQRPLRFEDYNGKIKISLPHIETYVGQEEFSPKSISIKDRFFRPPHLIQAETKTKIFSARNVISPYAVEMNLLAVSPQSGKRVSRTATAHLKMKSAKKIGDEILTPTKPKASNQSSKNISRTNFTSIMSTIKDLKGLLIQNLE